MHSVLVLISTQRAKGGFPTVDRASSQKSKNLIAVHQLELIWVDRPASDLQHCEAAYNLSNGEWDGPIDETRCVSTYNDTNHPQYTGIVWEFNHPVSHAAVSEK